MLGLFQSAGWISFFSTAADVPRGPARNLQRHRQLEETVAEAADKLRQKSWLPDPNTKLLFCPVKNKKKYLLNER